MINLGPFELEHPIGRGGMAEVWQGMHRRQGVPIALKVITTEQARNEHFLDAFRNEVRAVAGLDHPGVVMVFDYGTVSERAQDDSNGRLVAGSPYLAMELATGGSLAQVTRTFQWRELRQVLRALLDSLAHAHARGVIHRDIKPGNVLRATQADLRPGIKLSDFGLAHALERRTKPSEFEEIAGTPQYMAPEQFEGRWRDFGPWTDLYAVGIMTYELIAGHRPYDSEDFWELFYAHQQGPPRLKTDTPLPLGFDEWLERLMDPRPHRRFQRAADAAWALHRLSNPTAPKWLGGSGQPEGEPVRISHAPTVSYPDDWLGSEPSAVSWLDTATSMGSDMLFGTDEDSEHLSDDDDEDILDIFDDEPAPIISAKWRPPLPDHWHQPEHATRSMPLIGAGLGLYGLRSIPMIGRHSERDLLWKRLNHTDEHHRTNALIIRGGPGLGKSRLVEWLCERAHELGAATVLKTTHSPEPGATDGLPRMIRDHLGCTHLSRSNALERCQRLLARQGVHDSYEWEALTELMYPSQSDRGEASVRWGAATQRHVLIQRLCERLAMNRPVLIWVDDAHWGSDSIDFAHHMLRVRRLTDSPVLILLTVRDDLLRDRTEEARALRRLEALDRAETMTINALPDPDHSALVNHLLGLEGHLNDEVVQRTAGNPLFAIQLVGDWVQRGVLDASRRGFVLKTGEQAIIPDDIHTLWSGRIERFLEPRDQNVRHLLELASALGQRVDEREWRAAARQSGVQVPGELLGELANGRLIQLADGEWSFVHNMLRESLARSAAERHRWREHNLTCAQMLQRLYASGESFYDDRLGRHLLAAGQPQNAMPALVKGVDQRVTWAQYHHAHQLLNLCEQAVENLGLEPSAAQRGQIMQKRALVYSEEGLIEECAALSLQTIQTATAHGWDEILPGALRVMGHVARRRNDLAAAQDAFSRGLELGMEQKDMDAVGGSLRGLGDVARQQNRLKDARQYMLRALAVFQRTNSLIGMASCFQGLGIIARKKGQLGKSMSHLKRALRVYETIGSQNGISHCLNSMAEVARYQGDLEAARTGYQRALSMGRAIGSGAGVFPKLNLGLVLIGLEQYRDAQAILEEARDEILDRGWKNLLGAVQVVMLPCLAHRRLWAKWDHCLAQAQELLKQTGMIERDIAQPAQRAGELALDAHEHSRALDAFAIARQQFEGLGEQKSVDALDIIMAGIPRDD